MSVEMFGHSRMFRPPFPHLLDPVHDRDLPVALVSFEAMFLSNQFVFFECSYGPFTSKRVERFSKRPVCGLPGLASVSNSRPVVEGLPDGRSGDVHGNM